MFYILGQSDEELDRENMAITARASNTVTFLLLHSELVTAPVQREVDTLTQRLTAKIERVRLLQLQLQHNATCLSLSTDNNSNSNNTV
jgi:hypothetical protein